MINQSLSSIDLEKYKFLDTWCPKQYKNEIFNIISSLSQQIDYNNNMRILFIVPESAGDIFLSTSLLRSIKELYDPCDIYFACKKAYFQILDDNPYISKTIEYVSIMDVQTLMEGTGDWPGLFDVSIFVTIATQKVSNYLNNGKSKIAFNLLRSNNASN